MVGMVNSDTSPIELASGNGGIDMYKKAGQSFPRAVREYVDTSAAEGAVSSSILHGSNKGRSYLQKKKKKEKESRQRGAIPYWVYSEKPELYHLLFVFLDCNLRNDT